jgi:hypothetical protein
LPNSLVLPVTHVGEVILADSLVLKNVYYVPAFTVNLLSVSSLLTDPTLTVVFQSNSFVIQANKWKMIGRGNSHNGLYYLQSTASLDSIVSHKLVLPPFLFNCPDREELRILRSVFNFASFHKTIIDFSILPFIM